MGRGGEGDALRTRCKQKGFEGQTSEVEGLCFVAHGCNAKEISFLGSDFRVSLQPKCRKEGGCPQTAGGCSGVGPCLSWAFGGLCGLLISEAFCWRPGRVKGNFSQASGRDLQNVT